jgi:hypothetical protein
MRSPWSILVAALVPLVSLLPACSSAPAAPSAGEDTATAEQRALGFLNRRWPSPVIPVCWVNPAPGDAANRALVQSSVTSAFAPAGVTFTGWDTCVPGPTDRIEISVAEENPISAVGRGQPTTMTLNFTMKNGGPTTQAARCTDPARLQPCIQTAAVHEFAHAVGLRHEEQRTDALTNCGAPDNRLFDDSNVNLGAQDPTSILNHCNPGIIGVPSFQTTLSSGDIASIQLLFGHATATGSIEISLAPMLFPQWFVRTGTGAATAAPMDGPAQPDAVFTVVPALNGDASGVSFRSKTDPTLFLRANPGTPISLASVGADAAMITDASWRIDTNAVLAGDGGFEIFTIDGARAMRVGAQNQLYATPIPTSPYNTAEFSFAPRTVLEERFLRSGEDDPGTQDASAGTYLAHQGGQLVLTKLTPATAADGNWEIVAGIGNPQFVSIRFTDTAGAQWFVMENLGGVILASAATAKNDPSRATFQKQTMGVAGYRYLEQLDPSLALCQQNNVLTMCRTDNANIAFRDLFFWQSRPLSTNPVGVGPGPGGAPFDYCGGAMIMCLIGRELEYNTLSQKCLQLGGITPPCFFPDPTPYCVQRLGARLLGVRRIGLVRRVLHVRRREHASRRRERRAHRRQRRRRGRRSRAAPAVVAVTARLLPLPPWASCRRCDSARGPGGSDCGGARRRTA